MSAKLDVRKLGMTIEVCGNTLHIESMEFEGGKVFIHADGKCLRGFTTGPEHPQELEMLGSDGVPFYKTVWANRNTMTVINGDSLSLDYELSLHTQMSGDMRWVLVP